jgi:hypothetical protein
VVANAVLFRMGRQIQRAGFGEASATRYRLVAVYHGPKVLTAYLNIKSSDTVHSKLLHLKR